MPPLAVLISGAVLMGYLVAGLFFFRFWKETQDRLFASFAAAFWILALHRLLVEFYADGTTLARQAELARRMVPLVYESPGSSGNAIKRTK